LSTAPQPSGSRISIVPVAGRISQDADYYTKILECIPPSVTECHVVSPILEVQSWRGPKRRQ